ncbi:MAG: hypothetical protein EOP49_43375 [Sphingobacteriales bacterium]|nr:MAG: hypothetical protein EOP49_43375 [Sphingobacteriales bacterium]
MEKFKKTALGLMVAIIAFAFSAFTSTEKVNYQYWHFKTGQMLGDADQTSAYEPVTDPPQGCDNDEVLPCILRVDIDNPSTPNLASYLAGFPNDAAIASSAYIKRGN